MEIVATLGTGVGDQLGLVVVKLAQDCTLADRDALDVDVIVGDPLLANGWVQAILLDLDGVVVVDRADDDVADPHDRRSRRRPRNDRAGVDFGAELEEVVGHAIGA